LKVVYCSNPRNAKGLLTSAIECNDPVIFFEPKRCYRGPFYGDPHNVPTWKGHEDGDVPEGYYSIPLEEARIVREGKACTVIAWGTMVHVAQKGIEESGVDAELIDLQTLLPWDRDTVINSVKKTGRCVIVHEAPKTSGFGAEMSASIQERCFWHLEYPITRVTGWDTPFPHTTEWDYLPSPDRISAAIKKTQEV
jgi:2-oxoisovalerate dehydrogenase E1 component beta subunit